MPDSPPDESLDGPVLVPVGESVTLRQTVAYAIGLATEQRTPEVHFVSPVAWHGVGDVSADVHRRTNELLERVSVWAEEDAGEVPVSVETAVLGTDEYLFSPDDYARVLANYADDHGVSQIVVDPEYSPGGNVPLLRPMEAKLRQRGYDVDEAPVETPIRRTRLTGSGSLRSFGLLFGISFVFYQLLGGFAVVTGDTFDLYFELITGTVAAGITAGALHRVSMSSRPQFRRIAIQVARLVLFVPYLVYEIVKSNVLITWIILHPRLPIEPTMTRVRVAVWGGAPLTTLANSITLTPGTLTVRAEGQDLYVHTLFPGAREGLFEGSLERAVRFVFYGRAAAAIATPIERGACEVVSSGDATPEEAEAAFTPVDDDGADATDAPTTDGDGDEREDGDDATGGGGV